LATVTLSGTRFIPLLTLYRFSAAGSIRRPAPVCLTPLPLRLADP